MRQVNTRFFFILLGSVFVAGLALFGVHRLQAGNIASALLWQAGQAETSGKHETAARYLGRYLEFAPDDIEERAHLARLLADPRVAINPAKRRRAVFVIEQVLTKDPQRHELRLALVRLALAGRQFDLAKEHVDTLTRQQPKSADVLFCTAEWHAGQGLPETNDAAKRDHWRKGMELYRKAIDADPTKPEAYLKLVAMLKQVDVQKLNDVDRARHRKEIDARVTTVLARAPSDGAVLSLAAQYAQEKGDTETALKYLRTGLKSNPAEPRLYQELARLHALRGKRGEAIDCLKQGLQAVPKEDHIDLTWSLANLYLDNEDLGAAQKLIARMRDVNALSADYLQARVQMQQGRWYDAARTLERVRPAFKSVRELTFQVDLFLGLCYQKLDEAALQLASFERAFKSDPASLPARYGMAKAYWAQGRRGEALQVYREIIQGNTNRAESARWRVEYARILLQTNSAGALTNPRLWQDVEREVNEAEKDLRSVESALLRADLLARQGKQADAESVLRKAQSDYPDKHEPWIALANLAAADHKPEQAEAVLQEARGKLADGVDFRLAQLAYLGTHKEKATDALTRLEQKNDAFAPRDRSRLLEALAEAHFRAGRYRESIRLLKQVTALPHETQDVRLRMQLLQVAIMQGDDAEMQRVLAEVKRIEGDTTTDWSYGEAMRLVWRARTQGKSDELEQARTLLNAAAARRPDWHALFVARGEIDELQLKPDQAIRNYRKAVDLGSRDPNVSQRLILLLTKANAYAEVEKEARRMKEQFGLTPQVLKVFENLLANRHDPDQPERLARFMVAADARDYRQHLLLGQLLLANGQTGQEAELAFRRAVALGEKQPETWVALVRYLVATGRTEQAAAETEKAAKKLDAAQRSLALAGCYELLGNSEKAAAGYAEAMKARPTAPVARAAADFLVRSGQRAQAEPIYRQIIDRKLGATEDEAAQARHALAVVLARSGDTRRIAEALGLVSLRLDAAGKLREDSIAEQPDEQLAQARVLALVPRPAFRNRAITMLEGLHQKHLLTTDDQFQLARLMSANAPDEAAKAKVRDLMRKLIDSSPSDARYLGFAANQMLLQKDVAEAEPLVDRMERLEKDRRLPPNELGSLELRARLLEQTGKPNEAIALLDDYRKENLKAPGRAFVLASLYGRLGRYREAVDLCDQVRANGQRDDGFGVAVTILRTTRPAASETAKMKEWRAQSQRIQESLGEALKKKETDSNVLRLQLADLLDMLGQFDQVEALLRDVLARDADNFVALNNLAWLLSHRPGAAAEARSLIDRAIAKYGERYELLDTRAVVLLSLGQPADSVRELERIVRDVPTATRYFHLSRAHDRAKDAANARAALQRASELGLTEQQLHPSERPEYQRLTAALAKK